MLARFRIWTIDNVERFSHPAKDGCPHAP